MPRVLVVDDGEQFRSSLCEFLSLKGYEVLEAATGADALRALREWRPQAMLLDIRLPDMDGLAVLRQAKAIDLDMPVIMVTGLDEETVGREALQAGAFDYLTKPLPLHHLDKTLYHALSTMALA